MDDREAVQEAVRRKRARAEELGVPAAAIAFYDDAQHYPIWRETSPRHVPPRVLNARYSGEDPTGTDFFNLCVEFDYDERTYKISRIEDLTGCDADFAAAVQTLDVDGVEVLELSVLGELLEEGTRWRTSSIDRFVEGTWTGEFLRLCAEASAHAERLRATILAELRDPSVPSDETRRRFAISDEDLHEASAAPLAQLANGADDRPNLPESRDANGSLSETVLLAARALLRGIVRMTRAVLR